MFQNLKEQGYKYGTGYELATLGVLAMTDTDLTELTRDMIEVSEFLKGKRGFGIFGVARNSVLCMQALSQWKK